MPRPELTADCGNCAALCCVWSAFDASDDFAFAKPAGVPCRHLAGHRCAIHAQLAVRGLRGCAAYDCHGAGQRATRVFAAATLTDRERHDVFAVLREVHELLWLLAGAADLCPALRPELAPAIAALDAIAAGAAPALLAADLGPHRTAARALVRRVRAALTGNDRLHTVRRRAIVAG